MNKPLQFEQSITALQSIVKQLEDGDLPLEEALKQFEKGIVLTRQCQEILTQAEQKIEMLSTPQATSEPSSDA